MALWRPLWHRLGHVREAAGGVTALTPCSICGLDADVIAATMIWWAIDMRRGAEWQAQSVDWTAAHSGASCPSSQALRIVAAASMEAAPWLLCFAPVPGHKGSSPLQQPTMVFCRWARHGRVGTQTGRSPRPGDAKTGARMTSF